MSNSLSERLEMLIERGELDGAEREKSRRHNANALDDGSLNEPQFGGVASRRHNPPPRKKNPMAGHSKKTGRERANSLLLDTVINKCQIPQSVYIANTRRRLDGCKAPFRMNSPTPDP